MFEEGSYFVKDLDLFGEWVQSPRGVMKWLPELQNSWRMVNCHMTQLAADECSSGQRKGLGAWVEPGVEKRV